MAFFNNLTASLKQKWLQFFQVNRSWIARYMEVESVYTPDGGRRPPSYLILGVVNALEPQLASLMFPFSKLNLDVDALIDVLELNFDPDLVLGNRFNPIANLEELDDDTAPNVLIAVDPDELSDMSFDEMADEVVLVEIDEEPIVVLSADEAAALSDISLDEIADEVVLVEIDEEPTVVLSADEAAAGNMSLDEIAAAMGLEDSDDEFHKTPSATQSGTFGDDMSLDEIAAAMGLAESDDESHKTPSATQPDEEGDVLSDVWDEGTSSESEQADDETRLGDDKQSKHDQEISRLFPNS